MDGLISDMVLVLVILAGTVALFVTEIVRIDVAAIGVMVVIDLTGLVPSGEVFAGFSSNAVISIIAVMILGAGLDRVGVMRSVAAWLLRVGGQTERRVLVSVSATVGAKRVLAEHRCRRPVPAGGRASCRAHRPGRVPPAHADGVRCDPRRHAHAGRVRAADPAERPARLLGRQHRPGHRRLRAVRPHPHRAGHPRLWHRTVRARRAVVAALGADRARLVRCPARRGVDLRARSGPATRQGAPRQLAAR